MNFFNIGPGELLFILVFALIIFGPGKLPEVARGLGKAISDFRRASQGLTDGLTRELGTSSADGREGPGALPVQTASREETPTAADVRATAPPTLTLVETVAPKEEPKDVSAAEESRPEGGTGPASRPG